jgi:hypothetical protein
VYVSGVWHDGLKYPFQIPDRLMLCSSASLASNWCPHFRHFIDVVVPIWCWYSMCGKVAPPRIEGAGRWQLQTKCDGHKASAYLLLLSRLTKCAAPLLSQLWRRQKFRLAILDTGPRTSAGAFGPKGRESYWGDYSTVNSAQRLSTTSSIRPNGRVQIIDM